MLFQTIFFLFVFFFFNVREKSSIPLKPEREPSASFMLIQGGLWKRFFCAKGKRKADFGPHAKAAVFLYLQVRGRFLVLS